ncbi:hypothetical protein MHBO_004805 [Bonamia ostreae]|uniref:Uncharacterized protein n=1 Tax=Bonamia ostreae TaxID=126728 RepID=A0ABV2AUC0_9EUKA
MVPPNTTVYVTSTQTSSTEIECTVSLTQQENYTTVSDTLLMKSTEPPGNELTCKFRVQRELHGFRKSEYIYCHHCRISLFSNFDFSGKIWTVQTFVDIVF